MFICLFFLNAIFLLSVSHTVLVVFVLALCFQDFSWDSLESLLPEAPAEHFAWTWPAHVFSGLFAWLLQRAPRVLALQGLCAAPLGQRRDEQRKVPSW